MYLFLFDWIKKIIFISKFEKYKWVNITFYKIKYLDLYLFFDFLNFILVIIYLFINIYNSWYIYIYVTFYKYVMNRVVEKMKIFAADLTGLNCTNIHRETQVSVGFFTRFMFGLYRLSAGYHPA